jgi:hypothetical protein
MFIRRRCSLLRLILIALGLNLVLRRARVRGTWEGRSCADRASDRERARAFRKKMMEAMSVWTDPDFTAPDAATSAKSDATDEGL